jgi:hypothetical protein
MFMEVMGMAIRLWQKLSVNAMIAEPVLDRRLASISPNLGPGPKFG